MKELTTKNTKSTKEAPRTASLGVLGADLGELGGKNSSRGILFDIQRYSTEDGPGIRTTLFFKGCPLRCAWCCNPESWSPRPQLGLFKERCRACGSCREAGEFDTEICPHGARQVFGREWSVEEVVAEVERDRAFHRRSGGGVTFSGGEATAQPAFLGALAERLRARGCHLALETCGHFDWTENAQALARMDLVFLDLKHMDTVAHQRWTGVGTARIHANARRLAAAGIPLILRLPLVPGVNDGEGNLARTAAFASELGAPIEVLPYHRLGRPKWEALGLPGKALDLAPPAVEAVQRATGLLAEGGAKLAG